MAGSSPVPRPADVPMIGRAAPVLRAIGARVRELTGPRQSRETELVALKGAIRGKLEAFGTQHQYMTVIRDVLPEDAIVVTDVTQMGTYIQNAMPFHHPRSLITPGYQATLGYAYTTALGAKVGAPDKPVIAVCGDGGFMFTVQEISTAVAHDIPVVAIVFNDGAFGNVKRVQKDNFGGRFIASTLCNPDFVALADAFGALGLRAESPQELASCLATACAAGRPTVIDVPIGELPNVFTLIQRPRSQG